MSNKEEWDLIVKPKSSWFEFNFKEIWRYRDLLFMFVKRDIVSTYKQTILGPLWFFIQPILTALTFTIIFGNIANLSTDDKPKFLFYLAGTTCWNYFADCLNSTSGTFINNASIFGKVYFPRLISPLSVVISSVLKFLIQFLLFIGVFIVMYFNDANLQPNKLMLLIPFLVLLMGIMGLGLGIIVSSFTTKYRDLRFLISFGIQLFMYAWLVYKNNYCAPEHMQPCIIPFKNFLEKPKFISRDKQQLIFNADFLLDFDCILI